MCIRDSLPAGDLTAAMAFDVLSMGVGEDGTSGFPLVAVYLTGKELKAAMEEMGIRDRVRKEPMECPSRK